MGQKVHPTGFRLGVIYDWQSKWFAERNYRVFLHEDLSIRRHISKTLKDASVAKVELDRNANQVTVTIHTAKPGIVIGRGGQKVDELRTQLESLTNKRIRVNINEVRMPELDAQLVARNIADQLERRVAFRRALKQTVSRTMARGAEGCKATVGGRLGGSEMSRRESTMEGRVPLHTIRANIDYGQAEAATTFGRIGVKVWIYKGDIMPEKVEKAPAEAKAPEAKPAAEATETPPSAAEASAPEAKPAAEATESPPSAAEASAPEAKPAAEATETPPSAGEASAPEAKPAAEATEPSSSADEASAPEAKPAAEATETSPSAGEASAPEAKPAAEATETSPSGDEASAGDIEKQAPENEKQG